MDSNSKSVHLITVDGEEVLRLEYDRVLTDVEEKQLQENPYCMFKKK